MKEALEGRRQVFGARFLGRHFGRYSGLLAEAWRPAQRHPDKHQQPRRVSCIPQQRHCHSAAGRLMRSRGKHVDAELLYQEAGISLFQQKRPYSHLRTPPKLWQALTGRKRLLGQTHVDTLMTANNYGTLAKFSCTRLGSCCGHHPLQHDGLFAQACR